MNQGNAASFWVVVRAIKATCWGRALSRVLGLAFAMLDGGFSNHALPYIYILHKELGDRNRH